VTVDSLRLEIPNVKTHDGMLTSYVSHNGSAEFRDVNRGRISFTHAPRSTVITYSIDDPTDVRAPFQNNLGGENGKYSYLNPFAVWSILVSKEYNQDPDLSRVEQLELEFTGYFLPFQV
jgi:hypothetical protein